MSLALNLILLAAVTGLLSLLVWQSCVAAELIDARPRGAVISLPRDIKIISSNAPAIVLPTGTVLQESTPQGAATLGKIYDRQYILTIRTDNAQFSTNQPYQKSTEWITTYTFSASP
jgi:hypothetical protein